MKLFAFNRDIPYNCGPTEWAWVTFTTFKDAPGWGLFIHLPLPIKRNSYDIHTNQQTRGWHVPLIGFRHDQADCWLIKILVQWYKVVPTYGQVANNRDAADYRAIGEES